MATDRTAVLDAIAGAIEAVPDGLTWAQVLLDVRQEPSTRLHRHFALSVDARDTGKYRNHPARQLRIEDTVTVRCAWLLAPTAQRTTQRQAWADEQRAIQQILTDTDPPMGEVRRRYLRTRWAMSPSREWLFADLEIGAEYDLSLTTDPDPGA